MSRRILVVPTNHQAEITATSLGLAHALDEIGASVGYLKPLAQVPTGQHVRHAELLMEQVLTHLDVPEPISVQEIERDLARGGDDDLMEKVLAGSESVLNDHDVVIIEGVLPTEHQIYSGRVNHALAQAMDAEVLLVAGVNTTTLPTLLSKVAGSAAFYSVGEASRVLGVFLTGVPTNSTTSTGEFATSLATEGLRLVGVAHDSPESTWPRVRDLIDDLAATVIHEGDADRRVKRAQILAQSVPGCLDGIEDGVLAVVPGDRHDAIMAVCLSEMSGIRPAALLMTAGVRPDEQVRQLCQPALSSGLPVLLTHDHTFEAASKVIHRDTSIAIADVTRTHAVTKAFAEALDEDWLHGLPSADLERRLSPAAFRRQLTARARAANKRIVLPEGAEPRTVEAAVSCANKGVAHCVLLAKRDEVEATARSRGLVLPHDGIEIIDPTEIDQRYVDALVERRKHRGMTDLLARDELTDTVVLGTMMVHLGEADGLVSGAVHTTANTVRPALQVLGTTSDAKLVSSVFFMCLPDAVVVYGDCAINPDPNAEELADIAIQSADSAAAFGIEPRVAMISFSTGASGAGEDVEKVATATELVRQKRPDILIDGPLQYDAATTASVAKSKAPDSPVAGRATVFIFPDLNTGNTTYKAVQRSASVISVGPMLQGLSAPVNDLSRGALVEDIEYTIALTAIQAATAG